MPSITDKIAHDDSDEDLCTKGLRPFITDIEKFWQMGHNKIIPAAETALLRVLHASAKRLRKPLAVDPPKHFKKS